MEIEIVSSLAAVRPEEWDRLGGPDDPFVEHAFLQAMETSGSVGPKTGWTPQHILVRDRGRLVGAAPLYVKSHSYGEYIFDWGWANAAREAGLRYYPKVLSAVPFTPATGRRLLVEAQATSGPVVDALLRGMASVGDSIGSSSSHLLFITEAEYAGLQDSAPDVIPRLSYQFHWENRGYRDFEDYLGAFRSAARKQVRKERRVAAELGLEIRTLRGAEFTDAEWGVLYPLYEDTVRKKGSHAYLTPRFFDEIRKTFAHRTVASFAFRGTEPVAVALAFAKGEQLFGRYWGAAEEFQALHFELCYYQLIDFAIANKLRRVEAGAQGEHKLKRGFMPSPTYSAHWVRHPALADAIRDFTTREAKAVRREMEYLSEHGPFPRG
jgi:predicted N-acyltransferase